MRVRWAATEHARGLQLILACILLLVIRLAVRPGTLAFRRTEVRAGWRLGRWLPRGGSHSSRAMTCRAPVTRDGNQCGDETAEEAASSRPTGVPARASAQYL